MKNSGFNKAKLKYSNRYLFIPLVLLVFFFLFTLIYSDIKDRTVDEFNNEQLILAETAAQGITSFFADYQADLIFISTQPSIIRFDDNGKQILISFLENHKNLIAGLTRVDENGIISFTYPVNESVIGNDISYQKHVKQVITTHKPVISDVFMAVQGYQAIALHVPIFDGKTYAGSLAMLIPIDRLGKRYLGKIKIRGTGNIWLLSENGTEIYCTVPGHEGRSHLDNTNNEPSTVRLLEKIKTHEFGTAINIHKAHVVNGIEQFVQKRIAFYRAKLGNTYWTILISYQEEEIYTSLTRLRNRLIFVFTLLFFVVLYYFYSLTKVRALLKEEAKRKKAEKTLRESEEKFRTMFERSPIGIELYDRTGKQINANQASLDMFGIPTVAEVLNFNLFDGTSLDKEKKEKLTNGIAITYQSKFDFGKVIELKQYPTVKTGNAYFDYTVIPLLNPDDQSIDGYLVHVQDISERKYAEEEILMLAQSLKSVNECVSITDTDNRILFVNEAFLTTYGYSESELRGQPIELLRAETNENSNIDSINLATINGGWKGELYNLRNDGSIFPIYLSTNVIKDKDGKTIGLIGVASDITLRKRNEEELIRAKERAEESDRLKSAFLANMSHEIRTPMNGILGFADLLKEPDLSGEQQQYYLGIIEKSGERMLNIINDLINISRIEAGQVEVNLSETRLNEQLGFIHTFFTPEAENKGLAFTLHNSLAAKDLILSTDREKFYAILTNLVKNAIKYTKKGSIELGYMLEESPGLRTDTTTNRPKQAQKPKLTFYVRDTGIGIPLERQEAIFERFIQADIEDRQAMQGAGLGLAITKAYVEMLGGQLWVDSTEGLGSVFYFTLPYITKAQPLTSDPASISLREITPDPQNDLSKLTVLIAEDDESSAFFVETLLKSFSRELLKAKTGREAVELCRLHPDIDLILMDMQMPELNGYEATRQIRQFNSQVLIIAQTAYAILGDREKAIAAGCNDYITKPIRRFEFNALLHKYFSS